MIYAYKTLTLVKLYFSTFLCLCIQSIMYNKRFILQHQRSIREWTSNLINNFTKDTHKVRQIGDPVLRQVAKPVDLATIVTPDFKKLCDRLVSTLRRHNGCGIAAPQIGVPLQVIAVEFTGYDLKVAMDKYGSKGVSKLQMSLFPLKVMINPKIKIIDPTMLALKEGCLSVKGYRAMVPRVKEIEVEMLNVSGNTETFRSLGWTSRIIQHEVDHLQGNLFVDTMLYKTLINDSWNEFVD
ncbi:peptide deformylase, mitochondrial [Hydra vulgaris]|uniref:Peptide deformylase n=1 Tax=Hydra vulgaris TaxID=6087 RepID=A0ABM4DKX9_HYDVU